MAMSSTVAFSYRVSVLVISHFGFEDWIKVLIASVPDICILYTDQNRILHYSIYLGTFLYLVQLAHLVCRFDFRVE